MNLDAVAVRIIIVGFLVIALAQLCAGCSDAHSREPAAIAIEVVPERHAAYPLAVVPAVAVAIEPERASLDVQDTCDVLLAVRRRDGSRAVGKQLPAWWWEPQDRAAHQAMVAELIEVVADELGADDLATELLERKARLEASLNPGSVHVLNGDLEANRRWARFGRDLAAERWQSARVPIFEDVRGELVEVGDADAWSIGRGLYGMNSGLYMRHWSADAPPWSLCDPAIATVVAIWSIREGQERCDDKSLRQAYRWLSAGTCKERSAAKEANFDRLARGNVRGAKLPKISANADGDFGTRWPKETTDRAVLLAVLHRRIAAEVGL